MANLSIWQDSLTARLGRMLDVEIEPGSYAMANPGCTFVPVAYQSYVAGRGHLWSAKSREPVDQAIDSFRDAIAQDSSFAQAYAGLGLAYLHQYGATKEPKLREAALELADKASRLSPEMSGAAYLSGLVYADMNENQKAAEAFRAATCIDSIYWEPYMKLGRAYMAMDKYDSAEAAFEEALRLEPKSLDLCYWLGNSRICQDNYEGAIKPFKAMTVLRPDVAVGFNNLGVAYLDLDRWPEARSAFERSLAIEERWVTYSNLGSLYLYEARYKDAANAYEKAVALDLAKGGLDYQAWANYAEACYWIPQEREKSLTLFKMAISRAEDKLAGDPENLSIISDLASYCSMVGERDKADAYLDRVMDKQDLTGEAKFRIAETLEQLGRRDEAFVWLQKAIAAGSPASKIDRYPGLRSLRSDPRFQQIRGNR